MFEFKSISKLFHGVGNLFFPITSENKQILFSVFTKKKFNSLTQIARFFLVKLTDHEKVEGGHFFPSGI